ERLQLRRRLEAEVDGAGPQHAAKQVDLYAGRADVDICRHERLWRRRAGREPHDLAGDDARDIPRARRGCGDALGIEVGTGELERSRTAERTAPGRGVTV